MGNVKTGILSNVSGKVGPIVGAVLKGLNVIKKVPAKSSKAPSLSQTDQRSKFSLVIQLVTNLADSINKGFQSYTGLVSPRNAAVSYNLKHAITGVSPVFSIDYDEVRISKGSLPNGNNLALADLGTRNLQVSWDMENYEGMTNKEIRETDKCYAVFYSEVKNLCMESTGVVPRSAKVLEMNISKYFAGTDIHVFVFFISADGKAVSNSQYLGKILIAK